MLSREKSSNLARKANLLKKGDEGFMSTHCLSPLLKLAALDGLCYLTYIDIEGHLLWVIVYSDFPNVK